MSITRDEGDSIYSSGEEGGDCMYLYVHNSTFDPSIVIKNATNILHLIRTRIGNNES